MSDIGLFLFLLPGLACLAWTIYNLPIFKARRRLTATPIQPVATIEPEMTVRVTGTIEPLSEPLSAPLTGRRCVYYGAAVSEQRTGQHGTRWVQIHGVQRSVDFIVRDASGRVIVRVDRADIVAIPDHKRFSGSFDEPTPAESALLERFGEDATGFLGLNRHLRFTESALEIGEEVTVLGVARRSEGAGPMVIESPPDAPLLVTDHRGTVRAQRARAA